MFHQVAEHEKHLARRRKLKALQDAARKANLPIPRSLPNVPAPAKRPRTEQTKLSTAVSFEKTTLKTQANSLKTQANSLKTQANSETQTFSKNHTVSKNQANSETQTVSKNQAVSLETQADSEDQASSLETLEAQLIGLCRPHLVLPPRATELWSNPQLRILVIQVTDTLGVREAAIDWTRQLTGKKGRLVDLANLHRPVVVILDELWARAITPILECVPKNAAEAVARCVKRSVSNQQRAILLTSDAYTDDLRPVVSLRPKVAVVKCPPLPDAVVSQCIAKIARHQQIKLSSTKHNNLVTQCAGDVRSALSALQFPEAGCKEGGTELWRTAALLLDTQPLKEMVVRIPINNYEAFKKSLSGVGRVAKFGKRYTHTDADMATQQVVDARVVVHNLEGVKARMRLHEVEIKPVDETHPIQRPVDDMVAFVQSAYPSATVKVAARGDRVRAAMTRSNTQKTKIPPEHDRDLGDMVDLMAGVADDLVDADLMLSAYQYRDVLDPITQYLATESFRTRIRSSETFRSHRPMDTKSALTKSNVEVCEGQFYYLLAATKRSNTQARERQQKQIAAARLVKPPNPVAKGGMVGHQTQDENPILFTSRIAAEEQHLAGLANHLWGAYLPVSVDHDPLHDGRLYAAVALANNPPEVSEMKLNPDVEPTHPPTDARLLAAWLANRRPYFARAGSTAWIMAFSALAEGLDGQTAPSVVDQEIRAALLLADRVEWIKDVAPEPLALSYTTLLTKHFPPTWWKIEVTRVRAAARRLL